MYNVNFTGDCKNISDVSFVKCHTINNKALHMLHTLQDSLTTLKISDCVNVSDEGILELEHLQYVYKKKWNSIKSIIINIIIFLGH